MPLVTRHTTNHMKQEQSRRQSPPAQPAPAPIYIYTRRSKVAGSKPWRALIGLTLSDGEGDNHLRASVPVYSFRKHTQPPPHVFCRHLSRHISTLSPPYPAAYIKGNAHRRCGVSLTRLRAGAYPRIEKRPAIASTKTSRASLNPRSSGTDCTYAVPVLSTQRKTW